MNGLLASRIWPSPLRRGVRRRPARVLGLTARPARPLRGHRHGRAGRSARPDGRAAGGPGAVTGPGRGRAAALAVVRDAARAGSAAVARAAWCRAAAELAAARGDLTGAVDLAEPPPGALSVRPGPHAADPRPPAAPGPPDHRGGRTLDEAAETFDRLGARAWAERTAQERSRLGLRREAGDALTPTELRVARLAAAGRDQPGRSPTALAMSPKTVEAHLARIYRKLGIRSRAELGARWPPATSRTGDRTAQSWTDCGRSRGAACARRRGFRRGRDRPRPSRRGCCRRAPRRRAAHVAARSVPVRPRYRLRGGLGVGGLASHRCLHRSV